MQVVQAVVVAWDDVIAVGADAVAAFCVMFGLASSVGSGFDLGSDPLPVWGKPVMPVRCVPSAALACHGCSWVDRDRVPGSRPVVGFVAWPGKHGARRETKGRKEPAGKCWLVGDFAGGVAQLPVVGEELDLGGDPGDVPVS